MRLRASAVSRGHGVVRRGELVWDLQARPSPLGRLYAVRIRYRRGDTPEVVVVSPDLNELAAGRHLPHVYSTKPVRLCLFDPQTAEWSPSASIADTIVPWIYDTRIRACCTSRIRSRNFANGRPYAPITATWATKANEAIAGG